MAGPSPIERPPAFVVPAQPSRAPVSPQERFRSEQGVRLSEPLYLNGDGSNPIAKAAVVPLQDRIAIVAATATHDRRGIKVGQRITADFVSSSSDNPSPQLRQRVELFTPLIQTKPDIRSLAAVSSANSDALLAGALEVNGSLFLQSVRDGTTGDLKTFRIWRPGIETVTTTNLRMQRLGGPMVLSAIDVRYSSGNTDYVETECIVVNELNGVEMTRFTFGKGDLKTPNINNSGKNQLGIPASVTKVEFAYDATRNTLVGTGAVQTREDSPQLWMFTLDGTNFSPIAAKQIGFASQTSNVIIENGVVKVVASAADNRTHTTTLTHHRVSLANDGTFTGFQTTTQLARPVYSWQIGQVSLYGERFLAVYIGPDQGNHLLQSDISGMDPQLSLPDQSAHLLENTKITAPQLAKDRDGREYIIDTETVGPYGDQSVAVRVVE